MRLKQGRSFVRLVSSPHSPRPPSVEYVCQLAGIECLKPIPRVARLTRHAPTACARPPLCAVGVQGEALWEEVRVVPDWLVRRQLVQDQRPCDQLHGGEHDGGRGGTRHHRDRHAESRNRAWRLQHGRSPVCKIKERVVLISDPKMGSSLSSNSPLCNPHADK